MRNLKSIGLLFIALNFFGNISLAQEPFITTWKTDNPGESCDRCLVIPILEDDDLTYAYQVDWGDGMGYDTKTWNSHAVHMYNNPGTYTVKIKGVFPRIYLRGSQNFIADKSKIVEVNKWGDNEWTSMNQAFYRCDSLVIKASDIPDLSKVTNLGNMFEGVKEIQSDLSEWDVSTIENISSLFYNTTFNGDISNWDVSKVTGMVWPFGQCKEFNSDLSRWDVSSVRNMTAVFEGAESFNQDISGWDVSNVVQGGRMFNGASSFNQDISGWDVTSIPDMSSMFQNASSFNQDLNNWDVSNVTNMFGMFRLAKQFNADISQWDVSKVESMVWMFNGHLLLIES